MLSLVKKSQHREPTHHRAVRDQPDKRVGRQKAQADHQRLTQRLELVLVHASINDV
jgi:hypothetical protein